MTFVSQSLRTGFHENNTRIYSNEHEFYSYPSSVSLRKSMMTDIVYAELSFTIVGCAMAVHRQLGYGFLEKVNGNALSILLRKQGLSVQTQHPITVMFQGEIVGEYFADMLVEKKVILELKVAERVAEAHKAQALNYLKTTGLKLAIILNFGPKRLESHRIVN